MHAQLRRGQHQRVAHIVAVAHIRKVQPLHRPEPLLQREEIRNRLTRMLQVRQCIDHRHARARRHLRNRVVRVRAQHDHAHPPLHIVRHVGQRLALAQRRLCLVHKERTPAQRIDRRLERQPRAQRCLLKEHHQLARIQRMAKVLRIALHRVRQLHHRGHLLHGEVGDGAKIAPAQPLRRLGERSVGLDAQHHSVFCRAHRLRGFGLRIHHDGFTAHGIVLLPALRWLHSNE